MPTKKPEQLLDRFVRAANRTVSVTWWSGIRLRPHRLLAAAEQLGRADGAATDRYAVASPVTADRLLAIFDALVASPVGIAVHKAAGGIRKRLAALNTVWRTGPATYPRWVRWLILIMLIVVEAAGGYYATSLLWGLPDLLTWPAVILIAATLATANMLLGSALVGHGNGQRATKLAATLAGLCVLGFAAAVAAYRAAENRLNTALDQQANAQAGGRAARAARAAADTAVAEATDLVDTASIALIATVLALGLATGLLAEVLLHADNNTLALRLTRRTQNRRLHALGKIDRLAHDAAALSTTGTATSQLRHAVHTAYWTGYRHTCHPDLADRITTTGTHQYTPPAAYPWHTDAHTLHTLLTTYPQQPPTPALPLHPDTPTDPAHPNTTPAINNTPNRP